MSSRTMDPTIRAIAAIKREIKKAVDQGASLEDKLAIIDFGERALANLRKDLVVEQSGTVGGQLSASERTIFGDVGKL